MHFLLRFFIELNKYQIGLCGSQTVVGSWVVLDCPWACLPSAKRSPGWGCWEIATGWRAVAWSAWFAISGRRLGWSTGSPDCHPRPASPVAACAFAVSAVDWPSRSRSCPRDLAWASAVSPSSSSHSPFPSQSTFWDTEKCLLVQWVHYHLLKDERLTWRTATIPCPPASLWTNQRPPSSCDRQVDWRSGTFAQWRADAPRPSSIPFASQWRRHSTTQQCRSCCERCSALAEGPSCCPRLSSCPFLRKNTQTIDYLLEQ